MKQSSQQHDLFFKQSMQQPAIAKSLLENYLPLHFQKDLDLEHLVLCQQTFINPKLKLKLVDVLFKTKFKGEEAYAYILCEHQSTPDKLLPFRLMQYMLGIIDFHLKQNKTQELPIVFPLIIYNGKVKYPYSMDWFSLFGAKQELAKQILMEVDQGRTFVEQLTDRISDPRGESIMTIAEQLFEEGALKGKMEGMELVFKALDLIDNGYAISEAARITGVPLEYLKKHKVAH